MTEVLVEIDVRVRREEFEEEMSSVSTLSFTFRQSDNLHHKYFISTKYGTDLVWLGKTIQMFEDLLSI